jgi:hypothetical protein
MHKIVKKAGVRRMKKIVTERTTTAVASRPQRLPLMYSKYTHIKMNLHFKLHSQLPLQDSIFTIS